MKKSKRPKYRFILYKTLLDSNTLKLYLRDIFLYNHTYYEYTNLGLRVYEIESPYSLLKVASIHCEFTRTCLNIIPESCSYKTFHSYRKYKQFINNN